MGLPDYLSLRIGDSLLRVSKELAGDPKLDLLADPDLLFSHPRCEIIKDQKKIKVGRLRMELGGRVRGIYLKRYNAFSWRYRWSSIFLSSSAFRSLAGSEILLGAGIHTGRPVAAVECRSWGLLTKSFYISEEIPQGKTVDAYWREQLLPISGVEGWLRRRDYLKRLARLFVSLHGRGIYHNDLKDANIIVCPGDPSREESFYLLDLEGIRRYRVLSMRRRIKNLVQLNRTLGRFLRGSDKLYLLQSYIGDVFCDRRERRKWIRKVLKESRRRDLRSLRKK